jgi:uncharacterized protein YkwD
MATFPQAALVVAFAVLAGAICFARSLAQAASDQPTSSTAGLAIINATRRANGIPPVTLNAQWSAGCLAHDHYLALGSAQGQTTPHEERPGKPGYTAAGAAAAASSELVLGSDNWGGVNPWLDAPLHLASLLDPLVRQLGIGNAEGYSCAGSQDPNPVATATINRFYTYPADGRKDVAPSENTGSEIPNPTPLLGLTEDTGPFLFVYGDGPWMNSDTQWGHAIEGLSINQATLSTPDGTAVPLVTVDRSNPALGVDMPLSGVMLVPVHPLASKTTYTASVTLTTTDNVTLSHTWSFTTAFVAPAPKPASSGGGKVSRLRLSPSSLSRRQVAGGSISYQLSGESTEVQVFLTVKTLGYRVQGMCHDASWRSVDPSAPRCIAWPMLRQLTFNGGSAVGKGPHTLRLQRLAPHGLAVGSYELGVAADRGFVHLRFRVQP